MRLAVLALLLCAHSAFADSPRATVDALPEIAKVTRGRATVIVRGQLPRARHREMIQLVDQIITDTSHRFGIAKGDPHPSVTLCLFPDLASYRKVAALFGPIPSDLGFYMPDSRIALANIGNSIGNLRHELAHPMIEDDYANIPAWLAEGVGSLYGTARWTGDRFEYLVNYRLRDLRRALELGTLPSLGELAASTSREVRGPDGMVYYAYARYVLLYAEQHGTLAKLYGDLRAASTAEHPKILARYVDAKAFVKWVGALRY
jgi:hypothetical protein